MSIEHNNNTALASSYRITAVIYWQSAKVLNQNFESRRESVVGNLRAVPFYYLASHAVELLLKCALMKRGVPLADLKKRDLRHGLNELLALVKEKGVPISEQAFGLIVLLNKQHKEHSLRYSFLVEGEGSVFTPRAEEMFLLLEELLMAGRISTFGV